ncbi:MAG: metallophosphoesterase family protein [Bacteroidota bacterium]
MMKIGLLSDTHGYFDPRLTGFFKDCNEIWHAGDIGNIETADSIAAFKPLVAVYGNIDDAHVRSVYPLQQRFTREGVDIFMTHIGGYPGKYDRKVKELLLKYSPDLFISGHSHILKVINDKKLNILHINPGAAGKNGLHKVRTAVRFSLSESRIHDMEIWEVHR